MSSFASTIIQSGGMIVMGLITAIATTVTAVWGFFMGLWTNRITYGILLLIALVAMAWIPYQATVEAKIEHAARRVGTFYQVNIRPLIVRISQLYNILICWFDLYMHLMWNFWINIAFDLIQDCGGFQPIVGPAFNISSALFFDIFADQVLNLTILSRPIDITPIIQPVSDLIDGVENLLCCACNDLCPLIRAILDTFKDPNLWCFIQNVLNAVFFLLRPILDFLIRLLYAQPLQRPNFQLLGDYLCAAFQCATAVITNFLQRLIDNIFTIISSFQVSDITCALSVIGCILSYTLTMLLDVIFHIDELVLWPGNTWLISSTGLRSSFRRVVNMIAKPTEVVFIETDFPEYAADLGGAYDYSTQLLLSQTGIPQRLQDCGCSSLLALTAAIPVVTINLCSFLNVLTQLADLLMFLFDMLVNIFRWRKWSRRMDFAWAEGIFLPKTGMFAFIPEFFRNFNPYLANMLSAILGVMAELVRFAAEALRIISMGQDTFGVFIPDSAYTRPHIRCSRSTYPTAGPGAQSCSLKSWVNGYNPVLLIDFAANTCLFESLTADNIFFGFDIGYMCCVANGGAAAIDGFFKFLVFFFQNLAFGDPDLFWRGPSSSFQDLTEGVVYNVMIVLGCWCAAVRAIFKFFNFNTNGTDPCSCVQYGLSDLLSKFVRLGEGIIINFGRNISVNAPYFQAGMQQSAGVGRTMLSQLNPLGRPSGLGVKGDVEYLIEAVVGLLLCPLAITTMLPGFAPAVDTWRNALSAFFSAVARAFFATALAAAQADGDFFLDFTAAMTRDTFYRRTSKFVVLWIAPFDLIQTPIVWGDTGAPPDIADRSTGDPNMYPTNQGADTDDRVSPDIYIPSFPDGLSGDIKTIFDALEITLSLLFGTFGASNIGKRLLCPVRRVARFLISVIALAIELVSRILFSFINLQMKVVVIDWLFGCTVPLAARVQPIQSITTGTVNFNFVFPANCADTDGFVVAFVQIFRCPCDWISSISFSVVGCLCGTIAYQPTLLGAIGSAGIMTGISEFVATLALVALRIFRDGLLFQISIRNQVIGPLMVATGRALYGSTCVMVSIFGDHCSQVKWARVIRSATEVCYAIPVFLASIVSRDMQQNIVIPSDEYKGGQIGFAFVGWNDFRGKAGPCNPSVPKACNHQNADKPDEPGPGSDGIFNLVAGTMWPFTQFFIDVLDFIDCAIKSVLDRIGADGVAKVLTATLGGAVEIAKIIQSVFFSLLWFFWQFFRLLVWFLTKNFGTFTVPKFIDAATRIFKTIIRAFAGLFTDSHVYYLGDQPDDDIIEDCAQRQADGNYPLTQAGFIQCYNDFVGGSTGYPSNFEFINPSLNARRGGVGEGVVGYDEDAANATTTHNTRLPHRNAPLNTIPVSWVTELFGASAYNERPCRHGNLAQCICPWEPEVAGNSGLCTKGEVLDVAGEQALLVLYAASVWTGTTMCDALMRDAARRGWATVSVTERDELAKCMDQRAAGVRSARVMCGGLPPGAMCAWDANLWYQPARFSSFYTRARAAELMQRMHPIYPGGPKRYEAERTARANVARMRRATSVPDGAWQAWYARMEGIINGTVVANTTRRGAGAHAPMPEVVVATTPHAGRHAAISDGDASHAGRDASHNDTEHDAYNADLLWRGVIANSTATPPTSHPQGWVWGKTMLGLPPLPTPTEQAVLDKAHAVFIAEVRANLTAGRYDWGTSQWLLGQGDMPLDLAVRTYGTLLLPHVVSQGSPDMRVRPGAAFNDPNWRVGEQSHEETHREHGGSHAMTREQVSSLIWSTYDPNTLSGLGRVPGHRLIRYTLRGWDGPAHWATPAPLRSPQDNLRTWNKRVTERMESIRDTAERAGVIGEIASTVHGADPALQRVILRGAQAVDFLLYGYITGAFAAHWDTRHLEEGDDLPGDDGATRARKRGERENPSSPRRFDGVRSAIEDAPGGIYEAYDGFRFYNALLREGGGYHVGDLPGLIWNTTKAAGSWARGWASGGAKADGAPGTHPSRADEGAGSAPEDYPRFTRHGLTLEEEAAAEAANPTPPVNMTEVYGIPPLIWKGPEAWARWWHDLPGAWSRKAAQVVDAANGRDREHRVTVFRRREQERTRVESEMQWSRAANAKKFIFGGGTCILFDRILADFLSAFGYCRTTSSLLPLLTLRGEEGDEGDGYGARRNNDDAQLTLYRQGASPARVGLYSDDGNTLWSPPAHDEMWQGGIARTWGSDVRRGGVWVPQMKEGGGGGGSGGGGGGGTSPSYYDAPDGQSTSLRVYVGHDDDTYVSGNTAVRDAVARWEEGGEGNNVGGANNDANLNIDPYGRGGKWDPYGSHAPLPRHMWVNDEENGGYGGWNGKRSAMDETATTTTSHHYTRGLPPGRGYGTLWSALTLLVRLVDFIASKIAFLRNIRLAHFFEDLLGGTGSFLTNPNLDEDAGPLGLQGWWDVVSRCRFPRSLNCSHGVGGLVAFRRMFVWVVAGFILIQFIPGSTLLTMAAPYVVYIIFITYAWRWSVMCAFRLELPFCLVNDIEAVLSFIFRSCYDHIVRPYMVTDGIVCKPVGEELNIIDCTAVGVSNGFVAIAVIARLFSGRACGMVAGALESAVIIGPHGVGNQGVRYVRAICNSIVRPGDVLRRQQNFCAFNSLIDVSSVTILVLLAVAVLLLAWTIATTWVTLGVTAVTAGRTVVGAIGSTSTIAAEQQATYLTPYSP